MLISYLWLKKFVKFKAAPKELAKKLTLSLAEVENIQKRGDDTILEIENKGLTNRPDCFSHLGIAREVAAIFKEKLKNLLPPLSQKYFKPDTKPLPIEIKTEAKNLCPRYCAIVLSDIKVAPSPNWLQAALTNCGIRPINNVVDITNYVMLELGQPLHAFDYHKLSGQQIIVRRAKEGEILVSLDGVKRKLTKDNLVIADSEKPIGLAGIIGGENSEISIATKAVVLESANFEPKNNRLSAKNLGIRSEASTRFEKGQDPTLPLPALNRAVELLKKLAGAKVASETIDILNIKIIPKEIKLEIPWLNKFLGVNLSPQEITQILKSLELKVKQNDNFLLITVPSFRPDLTLEADIAEEVARIWGYDKIPTTLPIGDMKPPPENKELVWQRKTKLILKGLGLTEVQTYPLVGRELLSKAKISSDDHLRIINPLSVERELMRQSLIPSLLETASQNLRFYSKFSIYEIAKVFLPTQKGKQPLEPKRLTALVAGENYPKLKGILETLFKELGIKNIAFTPYTKSPLWHPVRTAKINFKERLLGFIGEIHPQVSANFEIKKEVVAFDLNFQEVLKLAKEDKKYQPLPSQPPIIEDLAFVVKPKTLVGEMIQIIKASSSIIQSVDLLDSYENIRTFRIVYQHPEKTLTDKEVKKIREKIIGSVEKKFEARIKG